MTVSTGTPKPALTCRTTDISHPQPGMGLIAAVFILALAASMAGFFGGPALGDHEAIVAQTARNMRLSGDWVLPTFLGQPWFRKPPLPYWLVAGASYLFPNDPATGQPVTVAAARLPSALAGLGTILLLWSLGSAMFGRQTGMVTAVIASSTILFLLYSPNATAEMPLTFCCVWAYLHFWHVATAREARRRHVHLVMFYIAMGMGMLAKGPAPCAMVGMPLAIWWYINRPLRILARSGPRAGRKIRASFLRGLWPRTREAFTKLWLIPGLVLFSLFFVPWMLAVAHRVPWAWHEWNWQYLQRAQGDYLDSRDRSPVYYLRYVVGFTVPWLFLLVEALLAPWLKRYARFQRPLLYAALWAVVAIGIMSAEAFKKPYYILPAMPGLLLLMAVVAERFYSQSVRPQKWMWTAIAATGVVLLGTVIGGAIWARQNYPSVAGSLTTVMVFAAVGLLAAWTAHIRSQTWAGFGIMAVVTVTAFQTVWHTSGEALDNVDRARELAQALSNLPPDARVLWASSRPDARVDFYFNRSTTYMTPPGEIVSEIQDRKKDKFELQVRVVSRAKALLEAPEPVYLIWERGNYERARTQAGLGGQVIATVGREGGAKGDKKDWLVVTNRP